MCGAGLQTGRVRLRRNQYLMASRPSFLGSGTNWIHTAVGPSPVWATEHQKNNSLWYFDTCEPIQSPLNRRQQKCMTYLHWQRLSPFILAWHVLKSPNAVSLGNCASFVILFRINPGASHRHLMMNPLIAWTDANMTNPRYSFQQ